ncbi:TPA: hypothetical protein ACH3X3_005013 [Trebouxia sp. C0006]
MPPSFMFTTETYHCRHLQATAFVPNSGDAASSCPKTYVEFVLWSAVASAPALNLDTGYNKIADQASTNEAVEEVLDQISKHHVKAWEL